MPLLAAGHKRTGACPTFDRPVLQRDGYLLRVPLIGGSLTTDQARAVAHMAATHGNALIELTNRGNLQVRGIGEGAVARSLDGLRAVAGRIGEGEEAERCAIFLRQLDPEWPPA